MRGVQTIGVGGAGSLDGAGVFGGKLALAAFAECHNASSMMRSSGTSVAIHLSRGLMGETRLPVAGSLT